MGKLRKKGWRVREGRRKEGEEDKRKREERKERMRSEAGQSSGPATYFSTSQKSHIPSLRKAWKSRESGRPLKTHNHTISLLILKPHQCPIKWKLVPQARDRSKG